MQRHGGGGRGQEKRQRPVVPTAARKTTPAAPGASGRAHFFTTVSYRRPVATELPRGSLRHIGYARAPSPGREARSQYAQQSSNPHGTLGSLADRDDRRVIRVSVAGGGLRS